MTQRYLRILFVLIHAALLTYPTQAQNTFFHKIDKERNPFTASQARAAAKKMLGLKSQEDLVQFRSETDPHGFRHERYQLTYQGIPIENGVVLIHYEGDGRVQVINGKWPPASENVSVKPSLAETEAIEIAKKFIGAKQYMWETKQRASAPRQDHSPKGVLVIYQGKLTYKVNISAAEPLSRDWVFVNAINGEVIGKIPRMASSIGTANTHYSGPQSIVTSTNAGGQYVLHDNTRGNGIFTYNMNHSTNVFDAVDFTDADNNWTAVEYNNANKDDALLDIHWNLQMVYDYWKNIHSRNSFDNMNGAVYGYGHYDNNLVNAFSGGNSLYFGDGNAYVQSLTSLDIVGHEFGHSVMDNTPGLNYVNESAAIHEGLADVWGACVENFINGLAGVTLPTPKNVWVNNSEVGVFTRHLDFPKMSGNPDTYLGQNYSFGVDPHRDGAVAAHWFYLISVGGTGTNDNGLNYSVPSIGISKAETILYHSLSYLIPDASFPDLKVATLQAANNLYGFASAEYNSVNSAWDAAGVWDPVPSSYCTPSTSAKPFSINQIKLLQQLPFTTNNSYEHYLNDYVKYLIPGKTYPFTGIANTVSSPKYWKVWMDFNRDGSFDDATELVFQAANILSDGVNGNVLVQSNAIQSSRMRIALSLSPITNACDPNALIKDYDVGFLPPSATITTDGYCIPFGSNSQSNFFSEVKLGTGVQGSQPNASGYSDATSSVQFHVWASERYIFKIVPNSNYGAGQDQHYTVWADYNHDKNFDPSEIIFQGHGLSTVAGNVTIPSSAQLGSTRMRVVMSRDSYATDPCIPVELGTIEDVPLVIHPSVELTSIDGYCTPKGNCSWDYLVSLTGVGMNAFTIGSTNYYNGPCNGCTNDTGFTDNTSQILNANVAQSYPLTLSSSVGAYWKIWIDYNHNKVFEPSEVVFYNSSPTSGTTLSASISPSFTNGLTRMRAIVSYLSPQSDPCQVVDDGLILDVGVNVNYCESRGKDSSNDWVDLVQIDALNNATGNNGGYADFTSLSAYPNLVQGVSYTLNLSAGTSSKVLRTRYFKAWIDFNRDGTFSDAETVASTSSTSLGILTTVLSIPPACSGICPDGQPTSTVGLTRLRVSMKYGSWPTACETFASGEVEDYTINITSSSSGGYSDARVAASQAEKNTNMETEAVALYPNPVKDMLRLSGTREQDQLSITDMLGKEVYQGTAKEEIDVSSLQAGMYLLTIISDSTKTLKFVKQ